jgi:REP element-mobilizing transposase RayT
MHVILVVKDRRPLISAELKRELFVQITHQVEKCDSKVLAINGCSDHAHVLISQHKRPKRLKNDMG